MGEEPIAGGRGVKERLCILWECPHCGYRNISGTTIQGTAKVGSKRKPMRFDCKFSGCSKRVRIVSQHQSRIIAAVPPQKRWKLKQLAGQLDLGKSEIDAAKIWDPDWKEGDELPFAFRRWKKWVGDV